MDRASTPSNRAPSRSVDEGHEKSALAVEVSLHPGARARVSDQMVLSGLPLADSWCYAGRGIDTDDVAQVARLAVVRAVRRYRLGEGHGLSVYVIPTVTGELKRWFRERGWWIRPPRRVQELRARALVAEERLRQALIREVDDDAIAAALGCCPLEVGVARALVGGHPPIPLDAASGPGGSLADELCLARCPEGDIDARDAFGHAIRALTEEQRLILRLRSIAWGSGLAGAAL